jgi:3-oxoacyl-[acyl-carrier protein] reductase
MSNDLTGKVALVTGSSRGLGAGIAMKLAACGTKVAVNYFGSEEKAKSVKQQINEQGGSAEIFKANVTDEQEVKQMCQKITETLGEIDILVINATGPQPIIKIEDLTWQDMLNQLDFFVKSPLYLVQQVIASMKRKKYGRIINIGSEVFETAAPLEFSNYISAKGAQLGLTRSWSSELAAFQITVNLVAPGWIPTERHANDSQEAKDQYAETVPLKRQGKAEDIGDTVAFLASDGANFITGQRISVNGGKTVE